MENGREVGKGVNGRINGELLNEWRGEEGFRF